MVSPKPLLHPPHFLPPSPCLPLPSFIQGGTLDLHGLPVTKRWTRLAVTSPKGQTLITLQDSAAAMGWHMNDDIMLTSSTYNTWCVHGGGEAVCACMYVGAWGV